MSGSSSALAQSRSDLRRPPLDGAIIGRLRRPAFVDEAQIVDEANAKSRRDRSHFVHAVGVEARNADLRRVLRTQVERRLPASVLDDQFAAAVGRGQHERHRREHAGDLLGVPVADEEAAGVVDEKLVEVGRNRPAHAQSEGHGGCEFAEGRLPMTPADPNAGGIDLPGSADAAIDHRLLAPAIGGRFGDRDEPLGLVGQDRKGDSADAVDVDRRHERLSNSADAEIARSFNGTQALTQICADRRHGRVPAGRRLTSKRSAVEAKIARECLRENPARASPAWPRRTPTRLPRKGDRQLGSQSRAVMSIWRATQDKTANTYVIEVPI